MPIFLSLLCRRAGQTVRSTVQQYRWAVNQIVPGPELNAAAVAPVGGGVALPGTSGALWPLVTPARPCLRSQWSSCSASTVPHWLAVACSSGHCLGPIGNSSCQGRGSQCGLRSSRM